VRNGLTPSDLGDFLEQPLVAILATHRSDGTVLLSPVWHEWREGGFNVATSSGDVKLRHLTRDPNASIVVAESSLPYRGIELRCTPRVFPDPKGEVSVRLAVRYLGEQRGRAYAATLGDDVVIRFEPGALRVWDFADEL
jgi:PPOX class probable F420-dependent enzyme